jgi:ATP-citrate lyase alpha-subunit
MLRGLGYSREETIEFVKLGGLNAFFVLGRSIGFMGHIMDQKRLSSRLYRHPWDDIAYMMPDEPEEVE